MAEAVGKDVRRREALPSLETPRNTILVQLPLVNEKVRLGMHTDSIGTLLKTFRGSAVDNQDLLDQIRIEGRVLTDLQEEQLESFPVYQFYMKGRISRGEQLVLPDSIGFTPEKMARLLQEAFSPSSLEGEIGYRTGYFSVGELVDQWLSDGDVNRLLPILGGVNEFRIGSDTLTQARLVEISRLLFQAFVDQEDSKLQFSSSQKKLIISGFKAFPLSSLKLGEIDSKINIIPEKTIFNDLKKINPYFEIKTPELNRK